MSLRFQHLWKNEDLSDAELVLCVEHPAPEQQQDAEAAQQQQDAAVDQQQEVEQQQDAAVQQQQVEQQQAKADTEHQVVAVKQEDADGPKQQQDAAAAEQQQDAGPQQQQDAEAAAEQQQNAAAAAAGMEQDAPAAVVVEVLLRMPAHRAILSTSSFFMAQIQRWQHKRKRDGEEAAAVCQLVLTLQHSGQLPAATAVLQGLYAVKPLQELFSSLTNCQQLHAAVLADMWALPEISNAAAVLLQAAANSTDEGLSAQAAKQLFRMPAYPDVLQPVLRAALLSTFGDLEAVWASEALWRQLLFLSLPAMQVLLGLDELQVASEDTVLYTAQRYARQHRITTEQSAWQQLASFIRAPHLSLFWVAGSLLSPSASDLLLSGFAEQLKQLLMVKLVAPETAIAAHRLSRLVLDAPSSWLLRQRTSKPVASVQVVWELEVSELRAAALRSAREQKNVYFPSNARSPPLRGLTFGLGLDIRWRADANGSDIVLLLGPCWNKEHGMHWCADVTVEVFGYLPNTYSECMGTRRHPMRWSNFFATGRMAGGWDERVWATAGFPSIGKLPITCTVSNFRCRC